MVDDLTLRHEALEIANASGLTLIGYTAQPGSPSDEALRPPSIWVATEPGPLTRRDHETKAPAPTQE